MQLKHCKQLAINNLDSKRFLCVFFLSAFLISFKGILFAQDSGSSGPTIVAPGELSDRERKKLDTEYKFQVRGKEQLLSPTFVAPGSTPTAISEAEVREQTEQEKLYRYFGISTQLYNEGRLEEAIAILEYILYKNPHDEYVNNWLRKMRTELEAQQNDWQKTSKKNAASLKKKQLRDLTEEGLGFYKQKRYDWALLRFSEILAIDPNNATAKSYMSKLKKYYAQEAKVESVISEKSKDNQEKTANRNQQAPEGEKIIPGSIKDESLSREERLDSVLEKLKNAHSETEAETLPGNQNIESVIAETKAKRVTYEKDLESKIEEIITRLKKEDERKRVLTFGPGDILMISVRDHPELSGRTSVKITGDIVLPLVNTPIPANGLTLEELTASIIETMKRYVKEPVVSVTVDEYKSKVFYFVDENSSTSYPITRANLTLRDALFITDWGQDRAVGRVLLIKPDKIAPLVKKIDAYDLIYRGKLLNDVRIENGDVIYVPHTFARGVTDYITGVMALPNAVSNSGQSTGVMNTTINTRDNVNTIKKYKVP